MGVQDDEQMGFDERTGDLLARRSRATRRRLGSEPVDLEQVANWLDGSLGEAQGREVERRVEADPELRAVVAELKRHTTDPKAVIGGSNVVSLAAHRERAERAGRNDRTDRTDRTEVVGAPSLGASPERSKRRPGLQRIVLSIGGVVAIAAIVFIVTRPAGPVAQGTSGAGLGIGAAELTLSASYTDRASCAINGTLAADGERRVWLVAKAGATDLGVVAPGPFSLNAKSCPDVACERLVAQPTSAPTPVVDAACEVSGLPTGAASVRLD